eukprot:175864-Hanusia_phi.AAC.2
MSGKLCSVVEEILSEASAFSDHSCLLRSQVLDLQRDHEILTDSVVQRREEVARLEGRKKALEHELEHVSEVLRSTLQSFVDWEKEPHADRLTSSRILAGSELDFSISSYESDDAVRADERWGGGEEVSRQSVPGHSRLEEVLHEIDQTKRSIETRVTELDERIALRNLQLHQLDRTVDRADHLASEICELYDMKQMELAEVEGKLSGVTVRLVAAEGDVDGQAEEALQSKTRMVEEMRMLADELQKLKVEKNAASSQLHEVKKMTEMAQKEANDIQVLERYMEREAGKLEVIVGRCEEQILRMLRNAEEMRGSLDHRQHQLNCKKAELEIHESILDRVRREAEELTDNISTSMFQANLKQSHLSEIEKQIQRKSVEFDHMSLVLLELRQQMETSTMSHAEKVREICKVCEGILVEVEAVRNDVERIQESYEDQSHDVVRLNQTFDDMSRALQEVRSKVEDETKQLQMLQKDEERRRQSLVELDCEVKKQKEVMESQQIEIMLSDKIIEKVGGALQETACQMDKLQEQFVLTKRTVEQDRKHLNDSLIAAKNQCSRQKEVAQEEFQSFLQNLSACKREAEQFHTEKMERLDATLRDQTAKLEASARKFQEVQQEMEAMRERKGKMDADMDMAREEMRRELKSVKELIVEERMVLKRLGAEKENLSSSLASIKDEVERATSDLTRSKRMSEEEEERLSQACQQLACAEIQLESRRKELEETRRRINLATEELEGTRLKSFELDEQNRVGQEHATRLREQLRSMRSEMLELSRSRLGGKESESLWDSKFESFQGMDGEEGSDVLRLLSESLETLKASKRNVEEEMERKESSLAELRAQVSQKRKELGDLQQEQSKLSEGVEEKRRELETLRETCGSLRDRLTGSQQKIDMLEEQRVRRASQVLRRRAFFVNDRMLLADRAGDLGARGEEEQDQEAGRGGGVCEQPAARRAGREGRERRRCEEEIG